MRMDDKITDKENFCSLITDGAIRLVEEMSKKYRTKDRIEILHHVCAEVEKRYPGSSLEYHLNQMRIPTTKDILDVIDVYIILTEIDPTATFARKPRERKAV